MCGSPLTVATGEGSTHGLELLHGSGNPPQRFCYYSPFMRAVRPCCAQLDAHHPQRVPGSLLARPWYIETHGREPAAKAFADLEARHCCRILRRSGRPPE